ncbi:MAG: hypothetical protein IPL28_24055 [Chloroflexi bacterium]|nr:hypothetical protein [Chloroflexota bacterium]
MTTICPPMSPTPPVQPQPMGLAVDPPRGAIYTGTGTGPDRAFSIATDQSCTSNCCDRTGAQDLSLIVYESVCSSSLNDCVVVDDTGLGWHRRTSFH